LVRVNANAADFDPTVIDAKFCVDGVSVSVSVGTTTFVPVPVSVDEIVGETPELDVTASVPFAAPESVGVKIKLIVQLALAASVVVHVVPLEAA
jgi:hypothetical protein